MTANNNISSADACIEFDDVVSGYKDFMILNNLSFKARRGAITLLIGPNGAGKSTVLKTLFGLLKPRQGKVLLNGENINGASQKDLLAKGIAFVPQGRNLFGQLPGINMVVYGCVLVVIVMFLPRGVAGLGDRWFKKSKEHT